MSEQKDLTQSRGLVATVSTTGTVDPAFATEMSSLRAYNIEHNFRAVEYRIESAQFVESGRDKIVEHALKERYDWLLQIDADAAPIPPNTLEHLLHMAFLMAPDADVVGAYCQLKNAPYLPTIDTGTGTWEPWFPGSGLVRVIRTGAHCHLAKTSAFRRFGPPWYRSRTVRGPAQSFADVDNFARIKLHGSNPFTDSDEWQQLIELAKKESLAPSVVGEDSGFCDALCAAGGRIYVDTSLVVGHVKREGITPAKLRDSLDKKAREFRLACGLQ